MDAAQRALLAAVPTSRHPGAPLASALDEFDRRLEVVAHHIGQGRGTAEVWERCETAVVAARAEAEAMRASPPGPTEFEALNARLGDVLGPLEEFAEIERELRRR